jgi:hypothetical protein
VLNRNRGRKALDEIHVRFLHLVKELARVSGEGFDVFALALGVNRVEGERRLARAAQTRNDNQFVAWDLEREVLEIMLTRAADLDKFFAHRLGFSKSDNRKI